MNVERVRKQIEVQRDYLLKNKWVATAPTNQADESCLVQSCKTGMFGAAHTLGGKATLPVAWAMARLGYPIDPSAEESFNGVTLVNDIVFKSGGEAIAVLEEALIVLKEYEIAVEEEAG